MNQTYIVKRGDTLYGISNQYGVSVADILKINSVDPKNLQVGEKLIIPNISGTNPNSSITYIVKKGDTLYSIAQKYGTNVNNIINLNNLKSDNLSIGQILYIPDYYQDDDNEIPNFINYVVKKGDTLYSIAKKNDLTQEQIIKDNSLNNDNLKIGQNLKIRINKVLECYGNNYIPNEIYYIVKKGDSLYSIAKKFNTTVDNLKTINNLSSNMLSIGQKIII